MSIASPPLRAPSLPGGSAPPPAAATIASLLNPELSADAGRKAYDRAGRIYPICRSITGDGVRKTLAVIAEDIPLAVSEVPTGTEVLDWTIPKEWNIADAYIADASGRRVVDFQRSNLHVMSYSVPVRGRLPLHELRRHIFTLPEEPKLVPYRTSYYRESWAFCMAHEDLLALPEGEYDVVIDATLKAGALTYAEHVKAGADTWPTGEEYILSAHVCHPSLANDNCSGLALLTELAARLSGVRTRNSYRFLFAPGTIGAIAWLARNDERARRLSGGLVVSCVGDAAPPAYKLSRNGAARVDRAMRHVLAHRPQQSAIEEFSPYGYDERQFCSPGFDLGVGLFQRSRFGRFREYHTSADDLSLIAPEHLADSFDILVRLIDILENDRRLVSTCQRGEPQLGRRGLYGAIGGDKNAAQRNMAMLWVLNLSDGRHGLLDIAERAGLPFASIRETADLLAAHGLLIGGD